MDRTQCQSWLEDKESTEEEMSASWRVHFNPFRFRSIHSNHSRPLSVNTSVRLPNPRCTAQGRHQHPTFFNRSVRSNNPNKIRLIKAQVHQVDKKWVVTEKPQDVEMECYSSHFYSQQEAHWYRTATRVADRPYTETDAIVDNERYHKITEVKSILIFSFGQICTKRSVGTGLSECSQM